MESTQGLRERSLSRTKLHWLLSHIILSEHWVFTGPVIVTATLWNNCNKVPGESNLGNRGFSSDHSLRRLPILAGKAWRRGCDGWPYCVCCGDPERERERGGFPLAPFILLIQICCHLHQVGGKFPISNMQIDAPSQTNPGDGNQGWL